MVVSAVKLVERDAAAARAREQRTGIEINPNVR
jgi:hypothetical protein